MANKLVSLFILSCILFNIGTSDYLQLTANGKTDQICQYPTNEVLAELLQLSMSDNEIIQTLGKDYVKGKNMMSNETMWRYDLCANDDYDKSTFVNDAVNIEALKDNKVKHIVFLTFAENRTVNHISIYSKDKEGRIREYMQFANGLEKNIVIEYE